MTDPKMRGAPAAEELRLDLYASRRKPASGTLSELRDRPPTTALRSPFPVKAEDRISVDIKTAARISGLSRSTLYRLIDARALKRVKVGGRTLLLISDLRRLLQEKAT